MLTRRDYYPVDRKLAPQVSLDFDWVEFPTTRFTMGTDDPAAPDGEQPARQVTVGSLAISPLVTVEQWAVFASATGYRTVAEVEGSSFASCIEAGRPVQDLDWWTEGQTTPEAPVAHIAWLDAWEFCRWAGVALPTEAQWARIALDSTSPFAHDRDARSGHGNADDGDRRWVWCEDWFSADYFRREQRVNPIGPTSGTHRVVRGGATRATARVGVLPDLSAGDLGFRVVRH